MNSHTLALLYAEARNNELKALDTVIEQRQQWADIARMLKLEAALGRVSARVAQATSRLSQVR